LAGLSNYFLVSSLRFRRRSPEEFHKYWRQSATILSTQQSPDDGRSAFLTALFKKHCGPEARILEIGCNAGSNLSDLYRSGFHHLTGVDINPEALRLLRASHPELGDKLRMFHSPVEERIKLVADGEFDVVFTIAVLGHPQPTSEWVFAEMVRINAGVLISVEQRRTKSSWCVARDYQRVFEKLGMKLIEQPKLQGMSALDDYYFSALVFKKS